MKRLILFAVVVLMVAACGGGSGGESTDSTASGASSDEETGTTQAAASDNDSTPTTGDAPDTTGAADDGGGDVDGVGVGTVTIGSETFVFGDNGQPGLQCLPAAFGVGFLAALVSTDGAGGGLSMGVPFPGEEETAGILPELQVSLGEDEWFANEEWAAERDIPAGSSQIDSYDIEGNTISGTATFYNRDVPFGEPEEIETGTFEVTCAG